MYSIDTDTQGRKYLLTDKQKKANKNKWYKEHVDRLDKYSLINNGMWTGEDGGRTSASRWKQNNLS